MKTKPYSHSTFFFSRALLIGACLLMASSALMAVDYSHCITCKDVEKKDGTKTSILICCDRLENCLSKCASEGGEVPGIKGGFRDAYLAHVDDVSFGGSVAVQATSLFRNKNTWTRWLNRDDEGGKGDFETLKAFRKQGQACEEPQGIECQTLDGTDWKEAGQRYVCDKGIGGFCKNGAQKAGDRCENYRVRFLCPVEGLDLQFRREK
ncbi:MAG: hypothetical protein K0U98_08670 [Deltaproteobacteria bacterium]|nr:hypothetical protein [Deltaproteobacteria bacterium]